jgi:hypothetical protein
MSIRQLESTLAQKPAAPPVDLNAGRLDITRAILAGGFVVLALLVVLTGVWIFSWAESRILLFFGAMLAAIGFTLGAVVLWVSVSEWVDHRRRVADWHALALESYARLQGAETIQHVSEYELSADNPAHILLAALMVHMRIQAGESTPYSVRSLHGPYFLAGRRVGNMSKLSAELMSRKLAQLGLVDGRSPGLAGAWLPQSADEILEAIARKG